MKLKTSIIILAGCFGIFLFIMLPIVLSVQDKKEDYVASIKGSNFSLKDVNNNLITEESFQGPTTALFFVAYFFNKITKDLKKNDTTKVKKNLILVGGLSYLFLFGQIFFWYQLMQDEKFVTTNTYFSSFYIFTALHGLHLLGGLFFWGKVCSKTLKLKQSEIISQNKSISALSLYWTFLLIVWLIFFLTIYVFNDTVIAWCKALLT